MKLTEATKLAAKQSPIATAEDGKRFIFCSDAFLDWDENLDNEFKWYTATAFSPDDAPDEDGVYPCYDIYFEICKAKAEREEDACNWENVAAYKENGDWITMEDAKALSQLAR